MAFGGQVNTDLLSEETFTFLCRICKRKDKHVEGEIYCVECQDYFCLSCVKVHEDVPSLVDHNILGKGQFPSGSLKTRLGSIKTQTGSGKTQSDELTERCDRHKHNCIDMFCQNHDVIGCGTCMTVDHKSCQDIIYIPEYFKTNIGGISIKGMRRNLKTVIITLKEHLEELTKEKQKLMDMRATTLENIETFRKEMNERLDELEEYTIAVTEDKCNILLHEIEEEIKMLETNKSSAKAVYKKLEISSSSASQTFVNSKKVEALLSKADEIVESSKSTASSFDFTPDHRLSSLLEEMTCMGLVTVEMTAKTANMAKRIVPEKEDVFDINGSKKYEVKCQSNKERCDIVSACSVEDGTLILSDYNNKNLKRLHSTTYTVIDTCDLPGEPWQVCSINKQQAAVCLPYKREVHFISLTDKMKLTNKITTSSTCFGLAYAGGNLYISDDKTVYICSTSERKLKQFCKDKRGQELFSSISSLTIIQAGSKIYVCDWDNGLIVLDRNGTVVGEYNSVEIRGARGSCLAGEDRLLVCGEDSNSVIAFDLNGELINEVLKLDDENTYIQAVCCNQEVTKVLIFREWTNKIEVHDLTWQD